MERKCQYRNCGCTIPNDVRSHSKYCSSGCRDKERTYEKRERRRVNKEKEMVKDILIKSNEVNLSEDVIKLYNMIYGK